MPLSPGRRYGNYYCLYDGREAVNKKPQPESCEFCEGKLACRRIRIRFPFLGRVMYVEHVPARICSRCGEYYLDAPVFKRLEEIARRRSRIKKTISFPLADYDKAVA